MLFTTTITTAQEEKEVQEVFETVEESKVTAYVSSIAGSLYKQSVKEIAETKVGNKLVRNKNFREMMQESFFYGANRFGRNFIA